MAFNLSGERWNPNDLVVTWSIATQNFGGQPGGAFTGFINSQAVVTDIATAMSWWDVASGLTFQQVADGANVDIRIGYGVAPGGATGFTSYSFDPGTGYFFSGITVRLEYSDAAPAPRPLIAHEVGHAIGLDHIESEQAIMNSTVSGAFTGLLASDIQGVQFLYGAGGSPPPTDDFAGTTATTGQVSPGNSVSGNLEVAADRDWFRVQLNANTTYTINVLGADSGNGTLADPYLRIYNSTGSTILAQDDDAGTGRNSQVAFNPGTTGTYYIAAGAFNDAGTGTYFVTVSAPAGNPAVGTLDDVLWRHTDGTLTTADHNLGAVSNGWSVVGTGDTDGDGGTDIVWRNQDTVVLWEMQNGQYRTHHSLAQVGSSWSIAGLGDFDRDGDDDILWRNSDGRVLTWELEDNGLVRTHSLPSASSAWRVAGIGDFDGDGDDDLVWHSTQGQVVTWEMQNDVLRTTHSVAQASGGWNIQGTGDFDRDGDDDLVWRNAEGRVTTWEMQGNRLVVNHNIESGGNSWRIYGVHDFDTDGDSDILWRNDNGTVLTWEMNGFGFVRTHNFGVVSNAWQIRGVGDFDLA